MTENHDPYTVNVDGEYALQSACTCGWEGPARHMSDPHAVALLADDRAWHIERVTTT